MEVTNIRIRVVRGGKEDKLRAFATITLDHEFVVRDMKIIDGNNGLFVAMPSRKISVRCRSCGSKNALGACFCSDCGERVPPDSESSAEPRGKEYVDVAHPITQTCRSRIHQAVIAAYKAKRDGHHGDGHSGTTPDANAQATVDSDQKPASGADDDGAPTNARESPSPNGSPP